MDVLGRVNPKRIDRHEDLSEECALVITGHIAVDDPQATDVRELLERHLAFARANTPPDDVHALNADRLLDPGITLFSFRRNGELLGVGALKRLDSLHAEIKSMHTADRARGQGIGRALLDHLIRRARDQGFHRVSLETGTQEAFAPARRLYARAGFTICSPFGEYWDSPNSCCMTLVLESVP